jgi:hypothetical protein
MAAVSDEQGERFQQDISQMKKRYSGKLGPNMLANYCRSRVRETSTGELRRSECSMKKFFAVRIPYPDTFS